MRECKKKTQKTKNPTILLGKKLKGRKNIVIALNFPTRTKEKERNVGWSQMKRMALHEYSIQIFLLYFFPGIKIKTRNKGKGKGREILGKLLTMWQAWIRVGKENMVKNDVFSVVSYGRRVAGQWPPVRRPKCSTGGGKTEITLPSPPFPPNLNWVAFLRGSGWEQIEGEGIQRSTSVQT